MVVGNQMSEYPVDKARQNITAQVGWHLVGNALEQFRSGQDDAAEGQIAGRILRLFDELPDCASFVHHHDARSVRVGNRADTQSG